jgi:hypothetical protein
MDSVFFSPKWITPAGQIANVTENDVVSIQLTAIDDVSFTGVDNSTYFPFDEAANVASLEINGQTSSFLVNNGIVTAQSVIQANDAVYMTSNNSLNFTMLHDVLPNGLSLSNTGLISGRVLNLNTTVLLNDFTVRVSNGKKSRDRRFQIKVNPIPTTVTPPTWGNYSQKIYNDGSVSFSYVDLGKTTRGVPYEKEIDIFQSSGLSAQLELVPFLDTDPPFNNLPEGIVISGKNLTGYVETTNVKGDYYFKLRILDYNGNDVGGDNVRIFRITISPPDDLLAPLVLITWNTQSELGNLNENEPSPFSLSASSSTGTPLRYRLIYGSVLPAGLELDELTGEIRGLAAHNGVTQTTVFTVRALVNEDSYLDKDFSITVITRYNTSSLLSLHVPLLKSAASKITSYIAGLSPSDYVYRPGDRNFGLRQDLNIYVVGGLTPSPNFLPTIKSSNYKAPIKLLLGDYKVEKVYHNGVYVYDVLYREVIDPNKDAGGYTVIGDVPSEAAVTNVFNGQRVYQTSLNNIRYETIRNFGFPTDTASLKYLQGVAGIENLPQWMRSKGAMTYAIVLGYYHPNKGNLVLNNITYSTEDPYHENPRSRGFSFDAYNFILEVQEVSAATTFDEDTTFDDQSGGVETIFDEIEYYNGFTIFINN